MAFHLGRDREAQILLEKCAVQMQMLAVCETDLLEIASMGYTIAEARLGLRAAQGDRKLAVEQIMKRREEKQEMRKKEEQERELGKLRDKLGRCADGSWINIGYYKTLLGMGYTKKVAATALRQANNSLGQAVQLLQEQPDLIQLAAEERMGSGGDEDDDMQVNDEDLASLLSLGYNEEMARRALRNEGNVEAAADALVAGGGHVEEVDGTYGPQLPEGKRRRTQEEKDDRLRYKFFFCPRKLLGKKEAILRRIQGFWGQFVSAFLEPHSWLRGTNSFFDLKNIAMASVQVGTTY